MPPPGLHPPRRPVLQTRCCRNGHLRRRGPAGNMSLDPGDYILVFAHPDDGVLWASALLARARRDPSASATCKAGGFRRPPPLCRRLSPCQCRASRSRRPASSSAPLLSAARARRSRPPRRPASPGGRPARRYGANFARLTELLRPRLTGARTVVTHNPQGEYGHGNMSSCSARSSPCSATQLRPLGHRLCQREIQIPDGALHPASRAESVVLPTDPDLGARLQTLYRDRLLDTVRRLCGPRPGASTAGARRRSPPAPAPRSRSPHLARLDPKRRSSRLRRHRAAPCSHQAGLMGWRFALWLRLARIWAPEHRARWLALLDHPDAHAPFVHPPWSGVAQSSQGVKTSTLLSLGDPPHPGRTVLAARHGRGRLAPASCAACSGRRRAASVPARRHALRLSRTGGRALGQRPGPRARLLASLHPPSSVTAGGRMGSINARFEAAPDPGLPRAHAGVAPSSRSMPIDFDAYSRAQAQVRNAIGAASTISRPRRGDLPVHG